MNLAHMNMTSFILTCLQPQRVLIGMTMVFLPWASAGYAQQPPVEITQSEHIWLGQGHTVRARVADYPPYMFKNAKPEGISVDVLSAAARRYGFKVEFVPDTTGFAAAVLDVAGPRHQYDVLLTFTRTPEREKQFAITKDYLTAPWVLYARRDSPYIVGLESLGGKTIAAEKGYVITTKLKADYPSIHLLEVDKSADALTAVATGKADAYVGNLANASYFIKNQRLDNLVVAAPTPYGINTQAMAIRNDWPALASLVNKSIDAMTMEERNAISQKWGIVEIKTRIDYALVWQIVLIASLIILASLYWSHMRAAKALQASEEFARTTIDAMPEHICVIDRGGTIVMVNQAWRDFYDENSPDAAGTRYGIGCNYLEICHCAGGPGDSETTRMKSGIQQVIHGERDTFTLEYSCNSPAELRTFNARVVRFHGHSGNVLISHENITERKRAEQKLEHLARTDSLTGLANRRHFMTLAERELSRTLRYGGELSVLMIDIDHFKRVNDTHGHQAGDQVLESLGDICRTSFRDIDIVGRLGGEEFAVALPHTDRPQAIEVAERLRQTIQASAIPLPQGLPLQWTVSIGAATLANKTTNLDTLLGYADEALYAAKHAGRNRVCVHGTE